MCPDGLCEEAQEAGESKGCRFARCGRLVLDQVRLELRGSRLARPALDDGRRAHPPPARSNRGVGPWVHATDGGCDEWGRRRNGS